MQNDIRFENAKRLHERHAGIKPPPCPRMSHPVDIKIVRPHAVDPSERRIELRAAIVLHARPITLNEAIAPRCPSTADVDYVVPFGWRDLHQEAGLQDVPNELLAGPDDRPLLCLIWPRRPRSATKPSLFLLGHL